MTPKHPVLTSLEGQWQDMCAMLLWKHAAQGAMFTIAEMQAFSALKPSVVLLAEGRAEGVHLQLIPKEAWEALQQLNPDPEED